jgi:hypothetical protein
MWVLSTRVEESLIGQGSYRSTSFSQNDTPVYVFPAFCERVARLPSAHKLQDWPGKDVAPRGEGLCPGHSAIPFKELSSNNNQQRDT